MSIESIIGITSGIIGIVCGVYGGYIWLEKKMQKPSMSVLFDQLTDKKSSDAERRVILRKMNGYPLIKYRGSPVNSLSALIHFRLYDTIFLGNFTLFKKERLLLY